MRLRNAIALAGLVTSPLIGLKDQAGGRTAESQSDLRAEEMAKTCENLSALRLPEVQMNRARLQAQGQRIAGARLPDAAGKPGTGPEIVSTLAFCRITGAIRPEAGSDIRFEVWLPAAGWTGRFIGGNNGGLAGAINYPDLIAGIESGSAVASTDTGHVAGYSDASWAKGHPEKVRDYGWRAIHRTTQTAKQLIAAFYGRKPDHSYFIGCSNGGRQGLVEASRFPEDYDGIVAGAPIARFTSQTQSSVFAIQVLSRPGAALWQEQIPLIQAEVLRQCDALDGQTDGLINDPRQCRFNSAKLACGLANSPACLTPPQLAALNMVHAGASDAAGRRLAYGYLPSGSEVGIPSRYFGWDGPIVNRFIPPDGNKTLAEATLTELANAPVGTTDTFDFSHDPARLRTALAEDLDARPDMKHFFARGGKLITWHGWADAVLPPEATIAFYDEMLAASGPAARRQSRLFMVPGVQHCMGGPGPDLLGQLGAPPPGTNPAHSFSAAIQSWVEAGQVPDALIGERSNGALARAAPGLPPLRQRLICAFPKQAALKPGAEPDLAASYYCTAPARKPLG